MKVTHIITLASCLLIGTQAFAQLTIDAELRTRGELYHGYKALASKNQEAGVSISQRTRLNFRYNSKWTELYVSFQDVRIWGNNPQLTVGSGGSTWLHQAYGVGKIAKWVDIKMGRQEIILDDHRIFGNVGWAQQARSHDAAILRFYPDSKTKIWLGAAYNQSKANLVGTLYTTPRNYKTMQFLWVNRSFGKVKASLLFLNNGLQTNANDSLGFLGTGGATSMITYSEKAVYFSQTIGFRAGYDGAKFKAFGAFYYQLGNNGAFTIDSSGTDVSGTFDFTRTKLNAMLARIDLLGKLGPVTLTGGYEYQSGNSQINPAADDQAFNPFYGTNHKFNGYMDYFYVGNHAKSVGLHDAFFGVKFKHKKFFIGATAHYFLAANDVSDPNNIGTAMNSGLGAELDIVTGYKFNKEVSILAGYSNMFGTSTMEAIRGGDKDALSNWAFLMITFKPVLFNSEKFTRKLQEKKAE
ncbi:MAG: hypothetical protein JKX84_06705 [Flavobacteriales bacterium]|nr:hypothetical protein [Flavobacteriales bacterium]